VSRWRIYFDSVSPSEFIEMTGKCSLCCVAFADLCAESSYSQFCSGEVSDYLSIDRLSETPKFRRRSLSGADGSIKIHD
jgi:hypothetical protein